MNKLDLEYILNNWKKVIERDEATTETEDLAESQLRLARISLIFMYNKKKQERSLLLVVY